MTHIFISYSRKDAECAYAIQRRLEARGYKVWIDRQDIAAGAPFPISILQAIHSASAVLILWSANAANSHYVNKEIEEALSQKMARSIPVIPVWLDSHPLHEQLQSLNAVKMPTCSREEFDHLLGKLKNVPVYRELLPFDANKGLDEQGGKAVETLPNLLRLPLVKSVYCNGEIVAPPQTSLAMVKRQYGKVQVCLKFLGSVTDNDDTLRQVYEALQTQQPDTPLFMFHFTGNGDNKNYKLVDDEEHSPYGDWLDPVNTIYSTLEGTLGRGGAILQLFNAVPATLNFAIGMQFYRYWHVQLYQRTLSKRYQFVLDTQDL